MIIDVHSHFLPGIDDGSKDVATSLEMLKLSQQMGVDVCVATPHFYGTRQNLSQFLLNRESAFQRLQEAMMASGANYPKILLGA